MIEQSIKIKNEFSSLDSLLKFLEKETAYTVSKEYDHWEIRTNPSGQMEQCILIKKSNMQGAKAYFINDNTLKITHVIPNKVMNAYFGNSHKARKNILEVITGGIKSVALEGGQKKALSEIVDSMNSIVE